MKIKGFLAFFCSLLVFACATDSKYRILLDYGITNEFAQAAWFSYGAPIRDDMANFYEANPNGVYSIPYNVELNARNKMIDVFLRAQEEYKASDQYIEDLIKIRSSNKLNEYVFFSFNPGNWVNENNFNEEEYKRWMEENMPAHVPLTLAFIEKKEQTQRSLF